MKKINISDTRKFGNMEKDTLSEKIIPELGGGILASDRALEIVDHNKLLVLVFQLGYPLLPQHYLENKTFITIISK